MRKQNLKIQMLAGNNLKSCPDTRSKKTVTLITKIVIAKKYNLLKENEHQLCMSFCNE